MLLQEKRLLNAQATYDDSLCWFRRDLRLDDHAALYHALERSRRVHCIFLFDSEILDPLDRGDRRVAFLWQCVRELSEKLQELGSTLQVLHGRATVEVPKIAQKIGAQAVFCNRDYDPAAIERDAAVALELKEKGIAFHDFKDQVIFERNEVLAKTGRPYTVFTAYKNAWLAKLEDSPIPAYSTGKHLSSLAPCDPSPMPPLESLGFESSQPDFPAGMSGAEALFSDFLKRMENYHAMRDYPAADGTSRLSPHLRFGTLSIRRMVSAAHRKAGQGAQAFLSELVWRDFFQMILYHHPQLAAGRAYKPEFENLPFENDPAKFSAWRKGKTGYPLVDAAMRQLDLTGCMHNRLRMVAASFLVKDLHVDWRWGERHFAEKLLDFDFASNNGGWQWVASTGSDAQPWFRIFNPVTQSRRFDPKGAFIRRHLPELAACPDKWIHAPWLMPEEARSKIDYPEPIVDHAIARRKTLEIYKLNDEISASP